MRQAWILVVVFVVFAVLAAITGCKPKTETSTTPPTTTESKVTYTCPMHPEVTSDKPGKCPKCGMDLVKK